MIWYDSTNDMITDLVILGGECFGQRATGDIA